MLPYLSDEQMKEVASLLSSYFPHNPPITNVQYSACIRFIYGEWDKQGVLKSKKKLGSIKKIQSDYFFSRKFLKFLYDEFEKSNCYYGLVILCEMDAHRLGDEAVISKDVYKLNEMEKKYLKGIEFAKYCNSFKHMFSLYYWCARYFKECRYKEKSIEYFKLAIIESAKYYHKYFPNGDDYYSYRLSQGLEYIIKKDKKGLDFYNSYKNKISTSKYRTVFIKKAKQYKRRGR